MILFYIFILKFSNLSDNISKIIIIIINIKLLNQTS